MSKVILPLLSKNNSVIDYIYYELVDNHLNYFTIYDT